MFCSCIEKPIWFFVLLFQYSRRLTGFSRKTPLLVTWLVFVGLKSIIGISRSGFWSEWFGSMVSKFVNPEPISWCALATWRYHISLKYQKTSDIKMPDTSCFLVHSLCGPYFGFTTTTGLSISDQTVGLYIIRRSLSAVHADSVSGKNEKLSSYSNCPDQRGVDCRTT